MKFIFWKGVTGNDTKTTVYCLPNANRAKKKEEKKKRIKRQVNSRSARDWVAHKYKKNMT